MSDLRRYLDIVSGILLEAVSPRDLGTITHGPDLYIHYTNTDSQVRSILANGFDLKRFGATAKAVRMPGMMANDPVGVFALEYVEGEGTMDRPWVIFTLEPKPNCLTRPDPDFPGMSEDLKAKLVATFGMTGKRLSSLLQKNDIQVIHSLSEYVILDLKRIRIVATSL